jgi:hypothetical protein
MSIITSPKSEAKEPNKRKRPSRVGKDGIHQRHAQSMQMPRQNTYATSVDGDIDLSGLGLSQERLKHGIRHPHYGWVFAQEGCLAAADGSGIAGLVEGHMVVGLTVQEVHTVAVAAMAMIPAGRTAKLTKALAAC